MSFTFSKIVGGKEPIRNISMRNGIISYTMEKEPNNNCISCDYCVGCNNCYGLDYIKNINNFTEEMYESYMDFINECDEDFIELLNSYFKLTYKSNSNHLNIDAIKDNKIIENNNILKILFLFADSTRSYLLDYGLKINDLPELS